MANRIDIATIGHATGNLGICAVYQEPRDGRPSDVRAIAVLDVAAVAPRPPPSSNWTSDMTVIGARAVPESNAS